MPQAHVRQARNTYCTRDHSMQYRSPVHVGTQLQCTHHHTTPAYEVPNSFIISFSSGSPQHTMRPGRVLPDTFKHGAMHTNTLWKHISFHINKSTCRFVEQENAMVLSLVQTWISEAASAWTYNKTCPLVYKTQKIYAAADEKLISSELGPEHLEYTCKVRFFFLCHSALNFEYLILTLKWACCRV